jgi:hypothetical protein
MVVRVRYSEPKLNQQVEALLEESKGTKIEEFIV